MGPGAGEAHVEVESRRGSLGSGPKRGGGSGVGAGGRVGGGQLGHHEVPRGGPEGAGGGHKELRRQGLAPQ